LVGCFCLYFRPAFYICDIMDKNDVS
jgi:hypothetical protein